MHTFPYPPSPASDPALLNPSSEFRSNVYTMVRNIILFILLYLLLIGFGLVLLAVTTILGFKVITFKIGFITLAIGVGLFALGVMFFLFLVKFIFTRNKEDDPMQIQIFETDHPKLFAFIRKLAAEVKTDFPKKIYLTPDVNAAVFYNSSFWSMFFPVRKNLKIGLGLVNSLNVSEFKAALAHEFGHFSQRSMKVGSYVYTANKVIFNLVNERDSWDRTLEAWASAGGIFSLFSIATHFLVERVRAILAAAYNQLTLGYMSLSREMEYHADLVACSVAGTDQMTSTLRKIEFTDSAYNNALNHLNELTAQKKRSTNLYIMHNLAIQQLADDFNLPLKNGMPVISENELEKYRPQSRINIKNQWASHPSREEREKNIHKTPVMAEWDESSSWLLFEYPEETGKQMTGHVYALANPSFSGFEVISREEFHKNLKAEQERFKLPGIFKGFYDKRTISEFDPVNESKIPTDRAFEEIFSNDTQFLLNRFQMNQSDLTLLHSISESDRKKDFFEFNNEKVQFKNVQPVISSVEQEISDAKKTINDLDRHAFRYFYKSASRAGSSADLLQLYKSLFNNQKNWQDAAALLDRYQRCLQELGTIKTEEEASSCIRTANLIEIEFKKFLTELPFSLIEDQLIDYSYLKSYIENKSKFFFNVSSLDQQSINDFSAAVFKVCDVLGDKVFDARKRIAMLQEGLVPEHLKK